MRLDLLVTLKTVDLVRETAWLALTERLGWGDRLLGLVRHRLWRFDVDGGGEERCRSALGAELERSSSYYNPNKEALTWLPAGALDEGEALAETERASAAPSAGGSAWRLGLWVTDEGGAAESLRRASATRLRAEGLMLGALHTGNYWELHLRADSRAHAAELAAALALSRRRDQGLLLNPHYQEGRLLTLAPVEVAS